MVGGQYDLTESPGAGVALAQVAFKLLVFLSNQVYVVLVVELEEKYKRRK